MNPRNPITLLVLAALTGCAAAGGAGSPGAAVPPAAARSSPLGSPFADHPAGIGTPLILDRTDLRIGTTVSFSRMPSEGEMHDLQQVPALQHVVLALPAWPSEYAPLEVLNRLPEEADAIIVLRGYPPTRASAEAWNYVRTRLRIVLLVPGPPPNVGVIVDLNAMRGLERVIAEMDEPSRAGFERLQRPLSFLKVMD